MNLLSFLPPVPFLFLVTLAAAFSVPTEVLSLQVPGSLPAIGKSKSRKRHQDPQHAVTPQLHSYRGNLGYTCSKKSAGRGVEMVQQGKVLAWHVPTVCAGSDPGLSPLYFLSPQVLPAPQALLNVVQEPKKCAESLSEHMGYTKPVASSLCCLPSEGSWEDQKEDQPGT